MNDNTLNHFRDLAEVLSKRPRINITIFLMALQLESLKQYQNLLKNGQEFKGSFDPMFKTITIGGMTFPESELDTWMKLAFGSKPSKVVSHE